MIGFWLLGENLTQETQSWALVEVDGLRLSTVAGLLLHGLSVQDGAHVRPLAELGLALSEALDPGAQAVHVSLAALRDVLDNDGRGRGRDEVGVLAADVQEPGALAVLRREGGEPVSDVDQAGSVRDDGPVVALVVGDTLVPQALRVLVAVLEDGVHLHGGLVLHQVVIGLHVVPGETLLDDLDQNIDTLLVLLLCVQFPGVSRGSVASGGLFAKYLLDSSAQTLGVQGARVSSVVLGPGVGSS